MSHITIRLDSSVNAQRDRNWAKKHITAIHSSYVFEELLSRALSRFVESGDIRFKDPNLVGINLIHAETNRTYNMHTYDDTHHQLLTHEFTRETFDYETYMMILDEKEKFLRRLRARTRSRYISERVAGSRTTCSSSNLTSGTGMHVSISGVETSTSINECETKERKHDEQN